MGRQILNKTVNVDGIKIFYREAGNQKNLTAPSDCRFGSLNDQNF